MKTLKDKPLTEEQKKELKKKLTKKEIEKLITEKIKQLGKVILK